MQRPRAWHPPLCAGFPVLSIFSANTDQGSLAELALPLLFAACTGLLLWVLVYAFLRDGQRSALVASLAVAFLWALTPFVRSATEWGAPVAGLLAAWAVAALLSLWAVARSALPLARPTLIANTVAGTLILLPLLSIALAPEPGARTDNRLLAQDAAPDDVGDRPDIYYIVLDAHGRSDVLRDHYGIERGLAEELSDLGFYVAERSRANYNTTLHSIPSALNFSYIQKLIDANSGMATDQGIGELDLPWSVDLLERGQSLKSFRSLVRENALVRELHRFGYRFVAYSSGFWTTECPEADEYVESPWPLTQVQAAVLNVSPISLIASKLDWLSAHRVHRRRVLQALEGVARYAQDPQPTFVFLHLITPHHPFIFGENGEDVSRYDVAFSFTRPDAGGEGNVPERMNPEYVDAYAQQVRFLAKLVTKAVQKILADSPEPPIIIVQGDHGPNSRFPHSVPEERFPILNAYYLPSGPQGLYPEISPVNSFRIVLNRYFGAKLPRLPDVSFETSWKTPFIVERVGD